MYLYVLFLCFLQDVPASGGPKADQDQAFLESAACPEESVAAAAPFLKLSESAKTSQMLMSTRKENECETHATEKNATCFKLFKVHGCSLKFT